MVGPMFTTPTWRDSSVMTQQLNNNVTTHMMEDQDLDEWKKAFERVLREITGGERLVSVTSVFFGSRRLVFYNATDDLALIGNALVDNTTVEKLHLQILHLNERATMAFANGICQSQIKAIRLATVSFVDEDTTPGGGQRIAMILCNGIRSSKTLEELFVIGMGEFTSMFSVGIIETTSLKSFRYSRMERDLPVATQDLIRSLHNNSTLTNIEFHNQDIDDQDVGLLLESFPTNLPLVSLCLPSNKIGPLGAQGLLRAMANHSTWRKLDLCGNKTVGYDGLRLLGEELQNMHQYNNSTQPGINRNNNITNTSEQKFLSLNVICCAEWNDYNKEAKETKAAAHQQTMACKSAERALLEGVKDNVLIVELPLDENHLSADTLTKIKFYLQLNQMGRYLLGTNHGLATTIWCHVLAKCNRYQRRGNEWDYQSARSITFYFLREQPQLVMPRART